MLTLLEDKDRHQYVMVMLDLSLLPERENKFHSKPFPHYVMLEKQEMRMSGLCMILILGGGRITEGQNLNAIAEPAVEGGYVFQAERIRPPSAETIQAYFHTCLKLDSNPITDALSDIVKAYTIGEQKENLAQLSPALKQLPVLAIRKYAYEHAFAYFWELLELEEDGFEAWCDEIEHLVKGYTTIQYRTMKLALTKDLSLVDDITSKLAEQNEREFKIKQGLLQCFEQWSKGQNNKIKKVTMI